MSLTTTTEIRTGAGYCDYPFGLYLNKNVPLINKLIKGYHQI